MKKKLLLMLCAAMVCTGAFAQVDDDDELETEPSGVSFSAGGDMSSAYAWRGSLLTKGFNFQPYLEFYAGCFTLGMWNCTEANGKLKEFDLYTSITAGQVTFTLTDYFSQEDAGSADRPLYGDYHAHTTPQTFEFSVDWESEFGLDASMNLLFYGADKKWWLDEEDPDYEKNAYGTYFELGYTAAVKGVDFRPCVGMVFNQSTWYGDGTGTHKGFNVVNIGVKASKDVQITDHFSLPVYAVFGYNPQADDVAALVGFSVGF